LIVLRPSSLVDIPAANPVPPITAMNEAPSAFWDFSLRFYAQPGVAEACLELQDGAGADVNVMLYLLFVASHGRRLDDADIAALDAAVANWRDQVVRPLRAIRLHLKNVTDGPARDATERLRQEIKRSELAAERIQQHRIEREFPATTFGTAATSADTAVRINLDAYAKHRGGLPPAAAAHLINIFTQQQT